MGLVNSYFHTWIDGNTYHVASPDPAPPGQGKPFVVRLGEPGIIPLNVLVFATDEEHAKLRVVLALEECCQKDYRGQDGIEHTTWLNRGRQYELLNRLRRGVYELTVEPLDTDLMPGVQWASNGGL